jgi:hypothetical protein
MMWSSSMPCRLPADDDIPLGQYGRSNVGRLKTVYRMGLSLRYGRRMQTISGVHYNFSLPETALAFAAGAPARPRPPARNSGPTGYFSLIRNFRRHSWLPLYLFGASPGRLQHLRRRTHSPVAVAVRRYAVHAARDVAAHGAARLSERRTAITGRQLQQPRELRRLVAPRADRAVSAIRRARRAQRRRRLPAGRHDAAADRERVLRHDQAQAAAFAAASVRCTR